jgi:hypothetical protein
MEQLQLQAEHAQEVQLQCWLGLVPLVAASSATVGAASSEQVVQGLAPALLLLESSTQTQVAQQARRGVVGQQPPLGPNSSHLPFMRLAPWMILRIQT